MSGARRIGGDPCETPAPQSFDCQSGPLWVSQIQFVEWECSCGLAVDGFNKRRGCDFFAYPGFSVVWYFSHGGDGGVCQR